jgi:hypothetical protein
VSHGNKLKQEFVKELKSYYAMNLDSLAVSKSAKDFKKNDCAIDTLDIKEIMYKTIQASINNETDIIDSVKSSLLKFNLTSKTSSGKGYSFVVILDSEYRVKDTILLDRSIEVNEKNLYLTEVFLGQCKEDFIKITHFNKKSNFKLHPYKSIIDSTDTIFIDNNYKFIR